MARLGSAGQGRHGVAWPGEARQGEARQANNKQGEAMKNGALRKTRPAEHRAAQYAWRDGSRVKLDAGIAGAELDRIARERGGLVPAVIVDEARPEDAPLHDAFLWDDEAAGERYRQWQARDMIRSIRVVYAEAEESEPIYFHVSKSEGFEAGAYLPATVIAKDVDLVAQVRDELIGKIAGIHRDLDRLLAMVPTKRVNVIKAKRALDTAARRLEGVSG